MIRLSNAASGTRLAEGLMEDGLILSPVNGSPISALNAEMGIIDLDASDLAEEFLNATRTKKDGAFNGHTANLENVVKLMTKKVTGIHRFSKTVINPVIEDVLTSYEAGLVKSNPASKYVVNVMPLSLNPVLDSEAIEGFLKRIGTEYVKNEIRHMPQLIEQIETVLTEESFLACAKTSDEELNKYVSSVVYGRAGSPFWINDWQNVRPIGLIPALQDAYSKVNCVIYALFLNGLINGRLEGFDVTQITGNERSMLVALLRHATYNAGQYLNTILTDDAEGKEVIIAVKDKTVMVHQERYAKWVESDEDACIEAIMGAHAQNGMGKYGLSEAIDSPKYFKDHYKRLFAMKEAETRAQNNQLLNIKTARIIVSAIEATEDMDQTVKSERIRKMNELIDRMPFRGNQEPHKWVRHVVCTIIAPTTNVYLLLNTMEEWMDKNPEGTVEEASMVATIPVIAKWVATQIEVSKCEKTAAGIKSYVSSSKY